MSKSLMPQRDVLPKIGHRRTWLFEAVRKGEFPKPTVINSRLFWDSEVIDEWIRSHLRPQNAEVQLLVVTPDKGQPIKQVKERVVKAKLAPAPINKSVSLKHSLDKNPLSNDRNSKVINIQRPQKKSDVIPVCSGGHSKMPRNLVRRGKCIDVLSLCREKSIIKSTMNSFAAPKNHN